MITAEFKWTTTPTVKFAEIADSIENKHIRIAMNSAAVPLKDGIVSNTPVQTGTLRKSMRIKIKRYRKGGWAVVIGPKSGLTKTYKPRKGKAGRTLTPSRYNRIVDLGTKFFQGRHHVASVKQTAKGTFRERFFSKLSELTGYNIKF